MPDSLTTLVQIQLALERRPPNNSFPNPPDNTWLSSYADKKGFRWVEGDERRQILPYTGRIFRLVKGGFYSGLDNYAAWPNYYDPMPLGDAPYSGNDWILNTPPPYGGCDKAYNKAYEKFKDVALGANASWGATIAEGRDALGMIGTRCGQLFRSYRALRKGNFTRFCKELGIEKVKRKHRRLLTWNEGRKKSVIREVSRNSSGLWLEYWFGWAPLAGEIQTSTEILLTQAAGGQHWGTSGAKLAPKESFFVNSAGNGKRITEQGTYVVKTGAFVQYSNPNVALAQQMGLVNPLAIAWELVPFSFVVDWFTNIGDCIGALSDLYGVDLSYPYKTEFLRTSYQSEVVYNYYRPDYTTWYRYDYRTWQHRRSKGLISPVFVYPRIANFGQSLTRAATAVSLLVVLFSKK